MAFKTGEYLKRREGDVGLCGRAVVLDVRDGGETLDVLTFGGMRSLVARDVLDRMWETAGDGSKAALSWAWRVLPLGRGQAPNDLKWNTGEMRLEVWPWNDLSETLKNLARVGLRCGRLLEVKTFGPPGHQAQCQFFAVEGTYCEPIGHALGGDFPPFAEVGS